MQIYVTAGKEGGVYLLDATRIGVLYDRKSAADLCGTTADPCWGTFEGSIITQPILGWVDDTPIVVIPTFIADNTHAAGLVAYKIVVDAGRPHLEYIWSAPDRASREAVERFRGAPTRAVIANYRGEPIVWVADRQPDGLIFGVRLRDGVIVARARTAGVPNPYVAPIVIDDVLYVPTSVPRGDGDWLEGYKITSVE
jgi:hypothetical protein